MRPQERYYDRTKPVIRGLFTEMKIFQADERETFHLPSLLELNSLYYIFGGLIHSSFFKFDVKIESEQ